MRRRAIHALSCLAVGVAAACAGAQAAEHEPRGSGSGVDASDANVAAVVDAGDDRASIDSAVSSWTFSLVRLTDDHRFIPSKMFGGWGAHLGHLLRIRADRYWVDDSCAPGTCDVLANTRIDILRLGSSSQAAVIEKATFLPKNVQQNMASIASGSSIFTYGVDTATPALVECVYTPTSQRDPTCTSLPLEVGANANYVGAAIHPSGARLVWLSNVVDGGGGSFRFYANYGTGWNGPRTGGVGGYNDASYVVLSFPDRAAQGRFVMHAELISGLAPAWDYVGAIGRGNLLSDAAVTWTTLPSSSGVETMSPNDVFVDPDSGDTHVLSFTKQGDTAYHFMARGDSIGARLQAVIAGAYRARFVFAKGRLFVVHGLKADGLRVREVIRTSGKALDIDGAVAIRVPLPDGYDEIQGIYPESETYQTTPVEGVNVGIVARDHENEVLGVWMTPP